MTWRSYRVLKKEGWIRGIIAGILLLPMEAAAQPVPPGTVSIQEKISITRHNLSSAGLGDVKATNTADLCVFCHTPHGSSSTGTSTLSAPLWNRNLNYATTSTLYDGAWSFSFEGTLNDTKPTGYSRLCLSCHDGVIALGSVINKPDSGGYFTESPGPVGSITLSGAGTVIPYEMPLGTGFLAVGSAVLPALTGDTRYLGLDLRNDHPISFKFDTALVALDAELVDPGTPPLKINDPTPLAPSGGYQTGVKRYWSTNAAAPIDSVQCTSCHNPHAVTYPKFLRAPRFQDATEIGFLPAGAGSAPAGQIICLYCHSKPGWNNSTHDLSQAIRSAYPREDVPATGHPENYDFDGLHKVGEYACRNCHDPHTAQGAKRLHREGVTTFALGATDAIENTCYLCHSPNATALTAPPLPAGDLTTSANHRFCDQFQASCGSFSAVPRIAPDIYSEFAKDTSACLSSMSGTGSGMCLQLSGLATGHEPVFISRPEEGVQLKSEGGIPTPFNNEQTPGTGTVDIAHVECVDCHNPHQVNSPNSASVAYNGQPNTNPLPSSGHSGQGGRFKGMKGVGIDATGTRPVIVARCEPGFVACGTETTININHAILAGNYATANRDPVVYEICFRCHGNSYTNIWGPTSSLALRYPDDISVLTVPTGYASYPNIAFSPRSDPSTGAAAGGYSMKGFSNKWRELNPFSQDIDTPVLLSLDLARFGAVVFSHTQQTKNPAYHPVVLPGRNGAFQLCNQLSTAFGLDCSTGAVGGTTSVLVTTQTAGASTALSNLTIQCTDCHNSNAYDAYSNTMINLYSAATDASGLRGSLTESNLRGTDVWPALNSVTGFAYGAALERPAKAIGPHGSTNRRILRANYETDILATGRCFAEGNPAACVGIVGYDTVGGGHSISGGGAGSFNAHFARFLLCFNCHDRRAFDPDAVPVGGDQNPQWTRFFGLNTSTGVDSWWNGNLHMYHLRWTGAMCHECHYNVHSNVEAANTIYGDGQGGKLPPDSMDGMTDGVVGTHLINFGPTAEGTTAQKPMWFYDGAAFRCYLRCHNEVMDSCAYQATSTGTPNARWCAGGRNPGTSG